MKKNNIIYRAFGNNVSNNIFLLIAGMLVGIVLLGTLVTIQSSSEECVRDAQKTYGEYAFYVNGYNGNVEVIDQMENVESIYQIYQKDTYDSDEKLFRYTYTSGNILELLGYQILEGTYPKSPNEILVDYDYLIDNNFEVVIGEKISIQKREYIISGILKKTCPFQSDSIEQYDFLIYDNELEKKNNRLYVVFESYEDFATDLETVQKKLNVDVYPNWGIYLNLGYLNQINMFQQNEMIYRIIYIIIVICIGVTIFNIQKKCINDYYEKISVLNMIGIPMNLVLRTLVFYFLKYIIYGLCVGTILIYLVYALIYVGMYGSVVEYVKIICKLSYGKLLLSYSGIIFGVIFLIAPIAYRIKKMTPHQMLFTKKSIFIQKIRKTNKEIFENKGYHSIETRLAYHYLKSDKILQWILVVSINLALLLNILAGFYLKVNYSVQKCNDDMYYKVRTMEYYDEESEMFGGLLESYNKRFGFSQKAKIHALYEETGDAELDREKLSNEYIEFLGQDSNQYIEMFQTKRNTINVDVTIVGYNDFDYKELLERNNLTFEKKIDGNDAIVLKNIFSTEGNEEAFHNNIKIGDKIKLLGDGVETEDIELNIVALVEDIPLYPENGEYGIVLVITEEQFQRLFKQKVPQVFYVEEEIETKSSDGEILQKIVMNKNYVISYPKNEQIEIVELNKTIKIFTLILCGILVLTSIVVLFSSIYLRINVNINEYVMLEVIGMTPKKIVKIFAMEILLLYAKGAIIYLPLSYILTRSIYVLKYPITGGYLYQYPLGLSIRALVIGGLVVMTILIPIGKKINKINAIQELKKR